MRQWTAAIRTTCAKPRPVASTQILGSQMSKSTTTNRVAQDDQSKCANHKKEHEPRRAQEK